MRGALDEDEEGSYEVFPALVPVQWDTRQVYLEDGALAVMLKLRTSTGIHITFWPEDTAIPLGRRLLELGVSTAEGRVRPADSGSAMQPEQ